MCRSRSRKSRVLFVAGGCFHDHGDDVRGVLFEAAYSAFGVITGRVEVAEADVTYAFEFVVPVEEALNFKFCEAVVIFGVHGVLFVDWSVLGLAVDGGAGREDEVSDTGFGHGVEDVDCAVEGILFGFQHGFAGGFEGGEVDHGVK